MLYFGKRRKDLRRIAPASLDDLIKKAEEWDDRYVDVAIHSVERYGGERREDLIDDFLSYRTRGEFRLTNAHSKRLWLPQLLQSFLALHRKKARRGFAEVPDADVVYALVTLTHRKWACADSNIEFDLAKAKQMVRNALASTNFVASFDAGLYTNEKWTSEGVTGNLISFHCHAIVWMSSRSGLDRLRKQIRPRFEPILGNKNGARFDSLETEDDVTGALAYMGKMPFIGYRTVVSEKGKKTQKPTSKITFKSRYHLFQELKRYDLFQFWLAGGSGTQVLRDARSKLKASQKGGEEELHGSARYGAGTHKPRIYRWGKKAH